MTSFAVLTADFPSAARPEEGAFVTTLWGEVQSQGHSVRIVAPKRLPTTADRSGVEAGLSVARPRFVTPGVKRPFPRHRRNISHRNWIRAARSALEGSEAPDHLFGQFLHPAGQAVAELAPALGCGAFVEISEDTSERWLISQTSDEVRNLFQRFDGIVAVSESLVADATARFGVDPDKVLLARNGVADEWFETFDREEVRARLGLSPDLFVAVTVARHVPEKGVQVAADALAVVGPTAGGLFVGHGPHPPTGPAVRFSGPVPHGSVLDYLRAADVFVLPSLAEGCANAVLEAMAVGLPLVVSDRQFMHEVADESTALFIDPESPREVAEAIRRLHDDPSERAARAAASREAGSRFRIDERARTIVEWMVERRPAPPSGLSA